MTHKLKIVPLRKLKGSTNNITQAAGVCKCGWETPMLSPASVKLLVAAHAIEHGIEAPK